MSTLEILVYAGVALVLLLPLLWAVLHTIGSNKWSPHYQLALVVIAAYGILSAMAIPGYQDYALRKKIAESLIEASAPRLLISEYFLQHKKFPPTLGTAAHIRYEAESGALIVMLPAGVLDGKAVVISPTPGEAGKLVWACSGPDIPERERKHLAASCRQAARDK